MTFLSVVMNLRKNCLKEFNIVSVSVRSCGNFFDLVTNEIVDLHFVVRYLRGSLKC